MISALMHSIMLFGSAILSKFILKDNQKLKNSNTIVVLSWLIFVWICCVFVGLFLVIYGLASHNISILLSSILILLILAGCMALMFFGFRRIAEKEEKKEARAAQIKFAQQVKIAAQSELESIFAELKIQSPQTKFLITNQVEKQIMALSPADAQAMQARFASGEQRQSILRQLKLSCASLSTQATEGDAAILHTVSAFLSSL